MRKSKKDKPNEVANYLNFLHEVFGKHEKDKQPVKGKIKDLKQT